MSLTILEQLTAYIASGDVLKAEWAKFIVNKKLPLEDRWEAFIAAPSDWRHREDRSTDLPLQSLSDVLSSPYDDFHMEYGSSMDVEELFDDIDQKLDDGFEDLTQEMIDAGKEEAMKMKLGRWEYND